MPLTARLLRHITLSYIYKDNANSNLHIKTHFPCFVTLNNWKNLTRFTYFRLFNVLRCAILIRWWHAYFRTQFILVITQGDVYMKNLVHSRFIQFNQRLFWLIDIKIIYSHYRPSNIQKILSFSESGSANPLYNRDIFRRSTGGAVAGNDLSIGQMSTNINKTTCLSWDHSATYF